MKRQTKSVFWLAIAVLFMTVINTQAQEIYVDGSNSGYADGYNWGTAYPSLQTALSVALSGDIIRVAQGTYTPGTARTASFVLKSGVVVYGGFPPHGLGIRDCQRYPTVLSGDIGVANSDTDNSYHVVRADSVNDARLDGFEITGGNANDSVFTENAGGGVLVLNSSNVTLSNCIFRDNRATYYGGALAVVVGNVTGDHLTFDDNSSAGFGGAVSVNDAVLELAASRFCGNSAIRGGGLAVESSGEVTISDSLFNGNQAGKGGGLFADDRSTLLLRNVTVCHSTATADGAGLFGESKADLTLSNTIFWQNNLTSGSSQSIAVDYATLLVSYSYIEGGSSGIVTLNGARLTWSHSISDEIKFVDADGADDQAGTEDDDLHPAAGSSPTIDAGNNAGVVSSEDLDGFGRLSDVPEVPDTGAGTGAIVDMGCYECRRPIYVRAAATGLNDGSSWNNAFNALQDALAAAAARPGRDAVWVAAGTYRPDQGTAPGVSPGNRFNYFDLRDLEIYGGFAGEEQYLFQRDWRAHTTVLSGELSTSSPYDNSYHVVYITQQDPASLSCARHVILDGFTITGGFADNYNNTGDFSENGAGLYVDRANPVISNCIIRGNRAIGYGAGLYAWYARPRIVNCVFNGNDVSESNYTTGGFVGGSGGGLAARNSRPEVINCTLVNNHADDFGGGIYTDAGGQATVANSIFWNNSDGSGQPESGQLSGPAVVSYSFIQYLDTLAGNHNLAGIPRFVDAAGPDNTFGTADDDLHLAANSVCVDAGRNAALPADFLDLDGDGNLAEAWPYDLDKTWRFYNVPAAPETGSGSSPLVDMGAYESDGTVTAPPLELYVDDDNSGPEDGSLDHPFNTIQEAVDQARSGDTVMVYPGTYTGVGNRDITIPGNRDLVLQAVEGSDNTIIDCEGQARGISVKSGSAALLLDGFTITHGLTNWGGGLYIRSRPGNVEIRNCCFIDNEANLGGGAVGVYGTTAVFRDCSFSGSLAHKNGGAVHQEQSTLTFRGCTFAANHSAVNGDGDFGAGGAVYAHQNSSLKLEMCNFKDNLADASGGAVAVEDSAFDLVSTKFIYNEAGTDGGGLYGDNTDDNTQLANSLFLANQAGHYGGGFFMKETDNLRLVQLTISQNGADGGQGEPLYLENCADTVLKNSIVRCAESDYGSVLWGSSMTVSFNDIYPCGIWVSGSGSSISHGAGSQSADPRLTWDGHLTATSPCRDAGDNTALPADTADLDGDYNVTEPLPFDLDGCPRIEPNGDSVDMGAFEYGYGLQADYSNGTTLLEGPIFNSYSHACESTGHNLYQDLCTPLDQSPVNWAWGNDFSVAWSGYLYVPESGAYTFKSWVDGNIYIRVGDTVVADINTGGGGYNQTVTLTGGEWVPVSLSFDTNGGSNTMVFGWQPPGCQWEPVPRKYLSPFPRQACCPADFDHDCDVDGLDLADTDNVLGLGLATFANTFGSVGCQ